MLDLAKNLLSEAMRIPLASSEPRVVTFTIRSAGVTVLGESEDGNAEVLYAGSGNQKVRAHTDAVALIVKPHGKNHDYQINIPELRDPVEGAEWVLDGSFTDLAPRPFGQISPEIKAVMDHMNRNAIIRERQMLRALEQR